MKKELTIALIATGVALSLGLVSAQDSGISEETNQNSDVNVTVSNITKLDVRPTSLDYPNLNPGALNNESANEFQQVEIENIGSTDINNIYAESTMPDSSPFGTGDSSNYNSGNFIKLMTNTSTQGDYNNNIRGVSNYHYVNRVEYAEDPVPTYIQTLQGDNINNLDGVSFTTPEVDVGRFREGQEEYFYAIYYDSDNGGTTGACSGANGAVMLVGDEAHNPNNLGTYDFTDASAGDVTNVSIDNDLGSGDYYGAVNGLSIGDETYDVFTHCTNSPDTNLGEHHTLRSKFNVDPASPVDGTELSSSTDGTQGYLLSVTQRSNSLRPGENFPVDLAVEVPLGVSGGEVTEGALTLYASEYTN